MSIWTLTFIKFIRSAIGREFTGHQCAAVVAAVPAPHERHVVREHAADIGACARRHAWPYPKCRAVRQCLQDAHFAASCFGLQSVNMQSSHIPTHNAVLAPSPNLAPSARDSRRRTNCDGRLNDGIPFMIGLAS